MRNTILCWSFFLLAWVIPVTACNAAGAGSAPAPADSVRSNIWLVQALMAEIVTSASRALPPAPARIFLDPEDDEPACALFETAAFDVLSGAGYELYSSLEEDIPEDFDGLVMAFNVMEVDLAYPEVGRSLGIWQQWVGREIGVSVQVEMTMAATGRLLLRDNFHRQFLDHVPSSDFSAVNSRLYEFTTAEIAESGWRRRLEEVVVVSTLAGLVAVYFANTNN